MRKEESKSYLCGLFPQAVQSADFSLSRSTLGARQLNVSVEYTAGPSAGSHDFLVFETRLSEPRRNADSERMRAEKTNFRVRVRA
jgi:hypothetical protein